MKKGFTLVELIATIAILAVVLTIAFLAFNSVSVSIRQKQRDNLINDIIVAARKYNDNTQEDKVYVKTLIYEGYLTANEELILYDPVTHESINCSYVLFSLDHPNGKYHETDGKCDESADYFSSEILYCTTPGCIPDKKFPNKWINNKTVILGTNENDGDAYMWISPLAPDVTFNEKYYNIPIPGSGYINDTYEVIIKKGSKEIDRKSVRVKIDIIPPKVVEFDIDDSKYTNQDEELTFKIKDSESGLLGYAITKSKEEPTTWTEISGKEKTVTYDIGENARYYIWVKDVAGNTNALEIESSAFEVKKIDKEKPTCTLEGENTQWKNTNVTIYYGCEDELSGCQDNFKGGNKLFTSTAKTGNISEYTIKDIAGNETKCSSQTVDIYIDKTKPEISSVTISSKEKYKSKNVEIAIGDKELHSGTVKKCLNSENKSSSCTWGDFASKFDYTYNKNEGSGDSIDLYFFIKDLAGNVSDSLKKTYKLYKECDETVANGTEASYGTCDKACGDGQKCRDVYYIDKYFETSCPAGVDEDCTSCKIKDCCSEGTWAYHSCTSDGYVKQSKWNGCENKTNYRTTTTSCKSGYTNCKWTDCTSSRTKTQTCDYYEGGVKKSQTELNSTACTYICDYAWEDLFGDYKGHISYGSQENYGAKVNMSSVSKNWCKATGGPCKPTCGYEIKCASSKCGSALGKTNAQIDKTYGCDFGDSVWCSCNSNWC